MKLIKMLLDTYAKIFKTLQQENKKGKYASSPFSKFYFTTIPER